MTQAHHLPPLEPVGDFRSYVYGDVVIDDSVAIAAGVLIQAEQGSRITIAAGVCIGMGTVIHAQDGDLEIGSGANLGAGVLVYGNSKIGDRACIGASSSIVRATIAKEAIVPPCSLISGIAEPKLEHYPDQMDGDRDCPQNTNAAVSEQLSTECTTVVSQDSSILGDVEEVIAELHQEVDINALVESNSAQAKAYAKSQINRYIKRIFPQN
jgi:carbon dioxide concentrating mechanism protein CcmN